MKGRVFIITAFFLICGCTVMKLPDFANVPDKPGTYPRFTSKDSPIGQPDSDRAGYDIFFYDLDLNLDPDRKRIDGTVDIHFRTVDSLTGLQLDLYENLAVTGMKLSGDDVSWSRKERAVNVSLLHALIPGHDYVLRVEYGGKPTESKKPPLSDGVVWGKDNDGKPWAGVACETGGGSLWFPCKDHLSDEPDSVRLSLTVPAGLTVVSNGIMKSHTSGQEKERYTWQTGYPVNTCSITFYAGKYEHLRDTMLTSEGVLDLDYYVLPGNLERAKNHFLQVKDIISLYDRSYGPYPWMSEGFRLVESPFEGMGYQTAIAYGSGYSDRAWLGGDYVIVHEAAHEWWGNAVSVSDYSDIWLQDGFATYSEILFAESKLGYENSLLYARYNIAALIKNRFPVAGPAGVSYRNTGDKDSHNKGAMILHTIRNIVNDSTLFFHILQTFYSEHAGSSHVTSDDFIRVLEGKTGNAWQKFFGVYLYRREVPVLHWYYSPAGIESVSGTPFGSGGPVIAAKWTGVPEGFSMPVDFFCKDTGVTVRIEVTTTPSLFYDEMLMKCNKLTCNRRLSYFDAITGTGVMEEVRSVSPL